MDTNVAAAITYCRRVIDEGYMPVASHLLYPQIQSSSSSIIPKVGPADASAISGRSNSGKGFSSMQACRRVIDEGYMPVASHLLYPQILNDNDPNERDLGLLFGLALLRIAVGSA